MGIDQGKREGREDFIGGRKYFRGRKRVYQGKEESILWEGKRVFHRKEESGKKRIG